MSDIPDFPEAIVRFRQFLLTTGHSAELFWVFRDDLWQWSPTDVRVKYPLPVFNADLAKKVFTEGRERGLVEIRAVATVGPKVAASVWYPKYPSEEIQGWSDGLKLTISRPLPEAKIIGNFRWWLLRFLPSFQRYQRMAAFIGSREWATA
jgi:hypothetical protein